MRVERDLDFVRKDNQGYLCRGHACNQEVVESRQRNHQCQVQKLPDSFFFKVKVASLEKVPLFEETSL